MELSLRRASDVARRALEAANALEAGTEFTLSVFSDADVERAVSARREAVWDAVDRAAALYGAAYRLRAAIGRANAERGVSDLLAENARDEAVAKKLDALLALDETAGLLGRVGHDAEPDLAALERKRLSLRQAHEAGSAPSVSAGGFRRALEDSLALSVVDEAFRRAVRDRAARLRRARSERSDLLAARNGGSFVAVPDADAAVFREHGLID